MASRNNTRFAKHVTPTHSTTYRAGVLVAEGVEIAVRNGCVAHTPAMLHAGFSFTVQRCPHPGGHHLWSGFDCHPAAAWHPQRYLTFWWRDPGTHAWNSRCAAEASSSNFKLYTDRMQERSVPPSKQVENRLARVWHSHALEPKITGGIMAPSRVADAGNRARKKNTDRPTQSASTPLLPSSREHLCSGVQYRRASASRGACCCGQFAHVPLLAVFGSTKVHVVEITSTRPLRFSFGTACSAHLGHSRESRPLKRSDLDALS